MLLDTLFEDRNLGAGKRMGIAKDGASYKLLRIVEARAQSGIARLMFDAEGSPRILSGSSTRITNLRLENATYLASFHLQFKKNFKAAKGVLVITEASAEISGLGISVGPVYITEAKVGDILFAPVRTIRPVEIVEGYPIARLFYLPFELAKGRKEENE